MKLFPFLFFMILSITANAQNWEDSFDKAVIKSQEQGKKIVLVFSGSDWCAPCIILERDIWQSDEFGAYSKEHFIMYRADFPRKKSNKLPEKLAEENIKLAKKFNPKGHFPLVLLLDGDKNVLGVTGYKKISPLAYITHLNSLVK